MATACALLNDRTTLVLILALGLRKDPTPASIQRRWGVSRATAYRWMPKLCDARRIWEMLSRRQSKQQQRRAPDVDAVPLEGLFQ